MLHTAFVKISNECKRHDISELLECPKAVPQQLLYRLTPHPIRRYVHVEQVMEPLVTIDLDDMKIPRDEREFV